MSTGDGPRAAAPLVHVIVLNWNGWQDTIACLESVLRSDYPRFQVVVCDNGSTDGSLDRLVAWADGSEPPPRPDPDDTLGPLVSPVLPQPIGHTVLTRADAEGGGGGECDEARVVFVQTGANLGFAGGCNVGLRYALARGDGEFAWLLNNDTVVEPPALGALVARLQARPAAGQCGSRILYYDDPGRVQCWAGARYNPWLATTRRLGQGAPAAQTPDIEAVERDVDFVYAASSLVRRSFLEQVGLMEEGYFLYFEELDWARRGRAFGPAYEHAYEHAYAHDSVVYHREGRSIGTSDDWRQKSVLSDFYGLRNRLLVTRRFFPWAFPSVYCGVLGALFNRLSRRQFRRAAMVLGILRGRGTPPSPPTRAASQPLADLARR